MLSMKYGKLKLARLTLMLQSEEHNKQSALTDQLFTSLRY